MSLVPMPSSTAESFEPPKGDRGGRHRSDRPRHWDKRRMPVGGLIALIAGILVVVIGLGVGAYLFWQQKLHDDALAAYGTALTDYDGSVSERALALGTLDTANASLAATRVDAAAILGAATDGFVGPDEKAALAGAVAAFPPAEAEQPAEATQDPAASPDPSASPAPDGPGADAVIPPEELDQATIEELDAATAALIAATETIDAETTELTAQEAAATQARTDLDGLTGALVSSAATQGRAWLDAFVGKTAQAGRKLDGAIAALEASSAATPDRAGLLAQYVIWAGPAVPGALDDPASIYVVVDKLRAMQPVNWGPGDLKTPKVRVSGGQRLRAVAADALAAMDQALKAEGLPFSIISGYRSYDSQVRTYNNWVATDGSAEVADTHSARPGFSEHQTGLVADLGDAGATGCGGNQCFGNVATGIWLRQHAADYGFILRYDEGKQSLSGYIYEPWHFRYVGVPLAQAIRDAGNPTLEQWMGLPPAPDYKD